MSLEACLPADLRAATPAITPIAVGLSGAGVYRVEAAGRTYVLKVASDAEPIAAWRAKARIYQLASTAGLAPAVIYVDEARRAIVSAFVVDRSFPAWFFDPRTRELALAELGRTLRRVHELPLPADAHAQEPRAFLAATWSALASFAVPAFVGDAVRRVLDEEPPAAERAPVLSHNDVNPTNLVYDGEHVLLLDWDVAGPNDPLYDLAAIAVFLRMDEATCQRLLAAHDGAPIATLPARFTYLRRVVAALCGSMFLQLARQGGHAGASGAETFDATPSLGDIYQQMRAGALSPASADGQWRFGLALVKASVSIKT